MCAAFALAGIACVSAAATNASWLLGSRSSGSRRRLTARIFYGIAGILLLASAAIIAPFNT